MIDCQSLWVKGLNLVQQNQTEDGLEVWNSCLEQGGRDAMLIFNYALELDKQGESIRALQLLEMASRDHIYHPKLVNLYQWLVQQNEFPGELSPLAWLNHSPDELVSWWLISGVVLVSLWLVGRLQLLGKWSLSQWFQNTKMILSVGLSMVMVFLGLQIGLNLYEDWINSEHPSVLVAENTPIFEQSMGSEALKNVLQGQKGRLEIPSDIGVVPSLWPYQKLKKVKAEDRKRVKVRFSSGQSGYLWADNLLPLEVGNE